MNDIKNDIRSEGSIKATLPINKDGDLFLDLELAWEFGECFSEDYCSAGPFPHIVIDDFLPLWLIEEILNKFPTNRLPDDKLFESEFSGLHKR